MNGARRNWTERLIGRLFQLGLDALAIFDAFALGYLCRFQWGFSVEDGPPQPPALLDEYLIAWLLAGYVLLMFFRASGLYDCFKVRDPLEVLGPLLKAGAAAMILVLALSYFYRGFSYSRLAAVYSIIFGVVLLGMHHWAWEAYRNSLRTRGNGVTSVLLVGSRSIARFLGQRVATEPSCGFRIVAVADTVPIEEEAFPNLPRGDLQDLPHLLDVSGAHEVFVAHPAVGHHELLEMIELCERRGIRIRMVPATYDLLIDKGDFEEVGGIPLVTVNERRPQRGYRTIKRLLDIVVAALLLLIVWPFLLLVAVVIRRDSPGPALFRQTRVGRDGRPFTMLKYRTMVHEAETLLPSLMDVNTLPEPVFKIKEDPRVTRVGRLLRRYSIDEFPQLWNVLCGEMSLVGPRPEEEQMVARYNIWERRRLKLVPGITGLQQIHCRGCPSLQERVRWDILYLRKESLLLDLWILLRTLLAVVRGRGAC